MGLWLAILLPVFLRRIPPRGWVFLRKIFFLNMLRVDLKAKILIKLDLAARYPESTRYGGVGPSGLLFFCFYYCRWAGVKPPRLSGLDCRRCVVWGVDIGICWGI